MAQFRTAAPVVASGEVFFNGGNAVCIQASQMAETECRLMREKGCISFDG